MGSWLNVVLPQNIYTEQNIYTYEVIFAVGMRYLFPGEKVYCVLVNSELLYYKIVGDMDFVTQICLKRPIYQGEP